MAATATKSKAPQKTGASPSKGDDARTEAPIINQQPLQDEPPKGGLIKLTAEAKKALAAMRLAGFAEDYKPMSVMAGDVTAEVFSELKAKKTLDQSGERRVAKYKLIVTDAQIDPVDEPAREIKRRNRQKGAAATTASKAPRGSTVTATVEEMLRLLARIETEEKSANVEMGSQLNHRIVETKKKLADASGDDFEVILRELNTLVDDKRQLATDVRSEAFHRIEADSTFPERIYLPLLKRSR